MEPNKFIEKNLNNFIPISKSVNLENIKNVILSYSISKNIILISINGTLLYKGNFDFSKNDFNLTKINLKVDNKISKGLNISNNNNNNNDFIQKLKRISLTKDFIYIINNEKIYYSSFDQLSFSILKGPIQKKKIMSLVCSDSKVLFLTYAGILYQSNDKNKENQKLVNELLDYKISLISAGSNHFLALGSLRNNNYKIGEEKSTPQDKLCMLFSWGDNTYFQCGINKSNEYINYPMLISDTISIKQISSGNNHNIILLSDGNVIFFGNNQFNQCFSEKKEIVLLPRKEDIKKSSLSNEFYNSREEYIQNIKAKDNSSLLISNKGTLIFNGKIFNKKQKIFILDKVINNRPWSCFSDNFFLVLKNEINNNNLNSSVFKEIIDKQNSFSCKKKIFIHFCKNDNKNIKNGDFFFQKKLSKNKIPKKRNSDSLTFEYLKKEKNSEIFNSNSNNNEESLIKLRSYINALGISLTSTYDDSNISFRPSNLPPKSKEEQLLHRELVHQNRLKYVKILKRKQEMEKSHLLFLEKEKEKREKIKDYWIKEIIPKWPLYKGKNKIIKKYFYEGIPNVIRGKVWILCIGNKFCITKDYYDIGYKKSIQLIMKLSSKKTDDENYNEEDINKKINNYNDNTDNIETSQNISQEMILLSEKTKRKYSQFITKTLDKEKSIYIIDLDIERTFHYLGLFNKDSPLAENLREILRIFVVTRPDIGYVQGLSYIAGILLTQMDKFQAFTCFCNIILSPNIFTFYKLDGIGIKKRLDLFNLILKSNLSSIYYLFNENGVSPEHYLLEWIMTLFTRTFHIELVLRILDVYMLEGITAIYKAALVVFILLEKELINLDFSGILNKLKEIKEKSIDENLFLEQMKKIDFNDKIMNYIEHFNDDYLPIE